MLQIMQNSPVFFDADRSMLIFCGVVMTTKSRIAYLITIPSKTNAFIVPPILYVPVLYVTVIHARIGSCWNFNRRRLLFWL